MKQLITIIAILLTVSATAQKYSLNNVNDNHCEYRLEDKAGYIFTGVDMPCGYKVGDITKEGHKVLQVLPTWKPNPKYVKTAVKKIPSHQCLGTTSKGIRCRKMIADPKETMCSLHQNQK